MEGSEKRKEEEKRQEDACEVKETLAYKIVLAAIWSWQRVTVLWPNDSLADRHSGEGSTRSPKVTADAQARWSSDIGVRRPTLNTSLRGNSGCHSLFWLTRRFSITFF